METFQCQAITKLNRRCMRNATHYHAGKSLCDSHHALSLKKTIKIAIPIVKKYIK